MEGNASPVTAQCVGGTPALGPPRQRAHSARPDVARPAPSPAGTTRGRSFDPNTKGIIFKIFHGYYRQSYDHRGLG